MEVKILTLYKDIQVYETISSILRECVFTLYLPSLVAIVIIGVVVGVAVIVVFLFQF